jgi:hypothetical protein
LLRYWADPDAVAGELEQSEEMLNHLQEKMEQFPHSQQWKNMYEDELRKSAPIRLRFNQLQRKYK